MNGFCCTVGGDALDVVAAAGVDGALGTYAPTLGAGLAAASGGTVSCLLFLDYFVCLLASLYSLLLDNAWLSVDYTLGVCTASV